MDGEPIVKRAKKCSDGTTEREASLVFHNHSHGWFGFVTRSGECCTHRIDSPTRQQWCDASTAAAGERHLECLQTLAAQGLQLSPPASVARIEGHYTPLNRAAKAGQLSTVRYLLELGADPNQAARSHTPLDYVAETCQSIEVAQLLIGTPCRVPAHALVGYSENGANIERRKNRMVELACYSGERPTLFPFVEYLVRHHGADVNAESARYYCGSERVGIFLVERCGGELWTPITPSGSTLQDKWKHSRVFCDFARARILAVLQASHAGRLSRDPLGIVLDYAWLHVPRDT